MAHQKTDRELVNELVRRAFEMGYDRDRTGLTEQDQADLKDRTAVETEIMRRLIVRDERLSALQAEVANLKHARNTAWADLETELEQA